MPLTDEQIRASERKTAEAGHAVVEQVERCSLTGVRVTSALNNIHPSSPAHQNANHLTYADEMLTVLRSEIRELRRLVKEHAHRKERRENGVYLP